MCDGVISIAAVVNSILSSQNSTKENRSNQKNSQKKNSKSSAFYQEGISEGELIYTNILLYSWKYW